ncbi:MAG: selenium metabolism-associated LysR family transcriptional regulator [Actinomycetota bacterium]
MNISYLNTFITVVEARSFSAAARLLGLSQPAVSFQVQALEKELGAVLLERRGAGLALTAAGETVLIAAGRIVKNYEELVLSVNTARDMVTGHLVLEASTIPGEYIVPGLIGVFKEKYPKIDVTLNISDSGEVVRQVLARAADVGFTGALPDKSVKGLKTMVLAEDNLVLMVPASHALAGRKSAPIKAVLDQTFIMREPGSGTRKTFERSLKDAGLKPNDIKISMELDSNQAVISAVEANLGIAVLSSWPAKKAARLGGVAVLTVSDLNLKRDLYAVYDSSRPETPLRRAFLSLL